MEHHLQQQTHQYLPQPQIPEEKPISSLVTLVYTGIAITWVLIFIVGMGISHGGWAAWWSIIGLGIVIVIVLGFGLVNTHWKAHQRHQEEIKNQRHHRVMTELAIRLDHSAEHVSGTTSFRAISKYMGPAGSLTIKDVHMGHEQAELGPVLPSAPPFSSIIRQVRPGHLFLGQGMQGAIWGDVLDLLSTLNIGRPGMGKSTLLRSITGQLLEIGGKPILFDPHGSILDDLGTSFECAESPKEITASSRQLEQVLEHRLDLRRAGKRDFQPLLLIADEMPVISEQVPTALPVIRRIITEGRKVSMFSILSGVGAPASVIGDSMVRDAMASRYIFLTTPKQAGMAGIDTETAKPLLRQLEEAGPGKAILGRAGYKPELVAIPDTTVEDIRSFVVPRVVPDQFPGGSQVVPNENVHELFRPGGEQPEVELEKFSLLLEMVSQEKSQNEILEKIFPGMRKTDAAHEYRKYLAYFVREKGAMNGDDQ